MSTKRPYRLWVTHSGQTGYLMTCVGTYSSQAAAEEGLRRKRPEFAAMGIPIADSHIENTSDETRPSGPALPSERDLIERLTYLLDVYNRTDLVDHATRQRMSQRRRNVLDDAERYLGRPAIWRSA